MRCGNRAAAGRVSTRTHLRPPPACAPLTGVPLTGVPAPAKAPPCRRPAAVTVVRGRAAVVPPKSSGHREEEGEEVRRRRTPVAIARCLNSYCVSPAVEDGRPARPAECARACSVGHFSQLKIQARTGALATHARASRTEVAQPERRERTTRESSETGGPAGRRDEHERQARRGLRQERRERPG